MRQNSIAGPSLKDWLGLAVLVIAWGSAYGMTSIALADFDPATLVAVRLWIGAALLGVACLVTGAQLPPLSNAKAWGALVLIAATGTLFPFTLISTAQQSVPSALAAIYPAAAPLCVAVMAHFLVPGEGLSWRRAIGILIGFGGVAALFLPGLIGEADGAGLQAPLLPQMLLLAGALCYATSTIMVRLLGLSMNPIAMSFGFCACSALMSVPAGLIAGAALPESLSPASGLAALGLGLLSTGIGALVYVQCIQRVGPVFMSNVGNLAPFWSLMVGLTFLNESLPPTAFIGLGLILAGIWFVQHRPSQARA